MVERLSEKTLSQKYTTSFRRNRCECEIEETLSKNPEKFWYYNNGITIIADKIDQSMVGGGSHELGSFKLENLSIVNGAQTVSTIGKYFQKEGAKLEKVKVHARMSFNSKDFHDVCKRHSITIHEKMY